MQRAVLYLLDTSPWRHIFFALVPLGIVLLFLALCVGTGNTLTVYFRVFQAEYGGWTRAASFVSNSLNWFVYTMYLFLFLHALWKRKTRTLRMLCIFVIVHICITVFLVHAIKIVVGFPRPLVVLEGMGFEPFSLNARYHSFPSGHTAEIVSSALPLAMWFRCSFLSFFLGGIIAIVGFSRIYLSQHHMPDIMAGMMLGTLAGLLIHHFSSREQTYGYAPRQAPRQPF